MTRRCRLPAQAGVHVIHEQGPRPRTSRGGRGDRRRRGRHTDGDRLAGRCVRHRCRCPGVGVHGSRHGAGGEAAARGAATALRHPGDAALRPGRGRDDGHPGPGGTVTSAAPSSSSGSSGTSSRLHVVRLLLVGVLRVVRLLRTSPRPEQRVVTMRTHARLDAFGTYLFLAVRRPAALAAAVRLAEARRRRRRRHVQPIPRRLRPEPGQRVPRVAGSTWTRCWWLRSTSPARPRQRPTGWSTRCSDAPWCSSATTGTSGDWLRRPRPCCRGTPAGRTLRPSTPGAAIGLDPAGAIRVPPGTALDLGSTGQGLDGRPDRRRDRRPSWASRPWSAWAATSASPPPTAPRGRSRCPRTRPGRSHQQVLLAEGGLATSSTRVRRWTHRGVVRHHLLDPRTGRPVDEVWRTVSATGPVLRRRQHRLARPPSCWARHAPGWLADRGVAARLQPEQGVAVTTAGWPVSIHVPLEEGVMIEGPCSGTSTAAPAWSRWCCSASPPCWVCSPSAGGRAGGCRGFVTQAVHRNLALLAVVTVVVHVVTAVADEFVDIRWWHAVVPFTGTYERALAGRRRRRPRPAAARHRLEPAAHADAPPHLARGAPVGVPAVAQLDPARHRDGERHASGAVDGDGRLRRCGAHRTRLAARRARARPASRPRSCRPDRRRHDDADPEDPMTITFAQPAVAADHDDRPPSPVPVPSEVTVLPGPALLAGIERGPVARGPPRPARPPPAARPGHPDGRPRAHLAARPRRRRIPVRHEAGCARVGSSGARGQPERGRAGQQQGLRPRPHPPAPRPRRRRDDGPGARGPRGPSRAAGRAADGRRLRCARRSRSATTRSASDTHVAEPRFVAGQAKAVVELLLGPPQPARAPAGHPRPSPVTRAGRRCSATARPGRGSGCWRCTAPATTPGSAPPPSRARRCSRSAPPARCRWSARRRTATSSRDLMPRERHGRPVLVGGFHGSWATWETVASLRLSVSRMRTLGTPLGAGVLLSLGATTARST